MTAQRKPRRIDEAIAVRNRVLELIARHGTNRSANCKSRRTDLRWGPFSALLHTPFTPLPTDDPPPMDHQTAVLRQRKPKTLPYRLDLWCSGAPALQKPGKVMSIEWDAHGKVGLISFKRGPWQAEFCRMAESSTAPNVEPEEDV